MTKRSEIKENIIIAALKIIRTQGMRFVRHRALAEEAGVSLGSTTYHFNNIEDLVLSAFEYWHKREDVTKNPYFVAIERELQGVDISKINRNQLVDKLVEASKHYLRNQIIDKREDREIELAFQNEALRNKKLRQMLMTLWQSETNSIENLFRLLGSKVPQQDAEITFSLILHIEKRLMLVDSSENFEAEFLMITQCLRRHIQLVVASI